MILTQNICFQKTKIKLNSGTWMIFQSSVVIFQALEPLQPQWHLQPQQPQWPQWPRQPHFVKKITYPDDWIIPSSQTKKQALFVEWIIKNPSFYLIPFLSEAVGASPCYFFRNLLIKLKCPNLLKPLTTIIKQNCWFFYPSEPFSFVHFNRYTLYTISIKVKCSYDVSVSNSVARTITKMWNFFWPFTLPV